MRTVTAHMPLDRHGYEIMVEITGTYYHAKEPDDREIEDVRAHDSAGFVVDLAEEEFDAAMERLFVAAYEDIAARAEDRADYRREP